MSWRALLVHVKLYTEWSGHLEVAARLARRFDARLTGLCTLRDVALLRRCPGERVAGAEARIAEDYGRAGLLEERFRARMQALGVQCAWAVAEGGAGELLALEGRCHDLVVTEAHQSLRDEAGFAAAEYAVLGSRAPALVVPASGEFPQLGQRAVLAWDGGREAAAALRAALPLLRQCQAVLLLHGRTRQDFSDVTRAPPADPMAYLALHGIAAERRPLAAGEHEAAEEILSAAADSRADLLVMGAYGRSRFTRWTLGGTTSAVLEAAPLPVLLAH